MSEPLRVLIAGAPPLVHVGPKAMHAEPNHGPILGRDRELDVLDRLADDLLRGESGKLIVQGEAGIGKTTLLERFMATHTEFQIETGFGVDCEMELVWAALHQLCASMLEYLPKIPEPQAAALKAAFGLAGNGMPDPFLCGLAVLSLLTEAAEGSPVICVIDDAHALDRASLTTLGFVSRRLRAESVGMIFAVRAVPEELANIPVLHVEGLANRAAGALFDKVARVRLDPAVRERLIAETAGNPLAIVEFAEQGNVRRLAGGYEIPRSGRVADSIEASFLQTARALDPDAQRLLLLAAADPTGDATLLRRAALASGLNIPGGEGETLGRLAALAPTVRFRHPLVRSAIYDTATDADRREAHRALARASSPEDDSDRRVWHLAQSLDSPDEPVAADLERSALGARARGGWAAAAAFLARAAQITPESATRARRELAAATAYFQSGDAQGALTLLVSAHARGLDDRLLAQAQLLRGQLELYLTRGGDAPALLLDAARALTPFDPPLARETYLEAVQAAGFAGVLAAGETVGSIARAALSEAPLVAPARPVDLLLDAVSRFYADGAAAATSSARRANEALLASPPSPEAMRWTVLGANLAFETFDDELMVPLAERAVEVARQTGMVPLFVMAGWVLVGAKLLTGDLVGGDALLREVIAVAEDVGASAPGFAVVALRAWRGEVEDFDRLAAACRVAAEEIKEGHVLRFLDGITALLRNGTGEHRTALDFCQRMLNSDNPTYGLVAAFEYAEAASRAGTELEVVAAREYLATLTSAAHTGWGRGLRAVCRALLDDTVDPEASFRESVAEFAMTRMRSFLARVHLLFGEWLRREGRRQEGRQQLRTAYDLLSDMGCDAFAARAGRELGLSGEKTRRGPPSMDDELTAQELHVAQMAASGLSNREIAERLYLSHRTVASHLYRVYPKLGIASRNQLHLALQRGEPLASISRRATRRT
jgi:DNA-binding CsgD family transcriptional regulator